MIIVDNMLGLEGHIERGILLNQLLLVSKQIPIKLYNGRIEVNGVKYGCEYVDYTTDVIIAALEGAVTPANKSE